MEALRWVLLYLWAQSFSVEQFNRHTFQLCVINSVGHTGYGPLLVSYGTMDKVRKLLFEAESVNGTVNGNTLNGQHQYSPTPCLSLCYKQN